MRRELRERARLSKAQVARALDVSPSTLSGWESGRDPVGEIRTKYAYLLDGLNAKLATETEAAPTAERPVTSGTAPTAPPFSSPNLGQDEDGDDVELLVAAEPCVLCGHPAGQRVNLESSIVSASIEATKDAHWSRARVLSSRPHFSATRDGRPSS
ncbi:helix-turn-helix domain-containing protein [Streptomyces cellulosae]